MNDLAEYFNNKFETLSDADVNDKIEELKRTLFKMQYDIYKNQCNDMTSKLKNTYIHIYNDKFDYIIYVDHINYENNNICIHGKQYIYDEEYSNKLEFTENGCFKLSNHNKSYNIEQISKETAIEKICIWLDIMHDIMIE